MFSGVGGKFSIFATCRFGLVGGWVVCTLPMLVHGVGLGGSMPSTVGGGGGNLLNIAGQCSAWPGICGGWSCSAWHSSLRGKGGGKLLNFSL